MTLNPFVMGSPKHITCFDEQSPCILEQTSMCVIDIAQKKDNATTFPGQKQYIPWLSCMDGNGDKADVCHKQVGINPDDVASCLKSDIKQLLPEYFTKDKGIQGTPTVKVNGKVVGNGRVDASYVLIKKAICQADPSLAGCKLADPADADWAPEIEVRPQASVVV